VSCLVLYFTFESSHIPPFEVSLSLLHCIRYRQCFFNCYLPRNTTINSIMVGIRITLNLSTICCMHYHSDGTKLVMKSHFSGYKLFFINLLKVTFIFNLIIFLLGILLFLNRFLISISFYKI